ncbi:tetratricopeptide repeat protein [Peredibacter starrii]|uniref:Tetratricopeptide repeat protein n=1 Tax=Peredibacter starrii TaxID=28202 RepID=A0AAX4HP05_9BACT|nr:tetratricopeptide repeat protein [Peredibacter starrii]WPU64925.1 tetratricopeptide repeat protein [Peredibacter starrii]
MNKFSARLTTLFVASALAASSVLADVIDQETFKTHLRWNLMVPRDQFYIVKRDQTLYIETVNLQMFETLAGDIAKLKTNGQYIESINYSKDNFPAKPATVAIKLKDPSVELFSFYRDADKKYILDFWINADLVSEKNAGFKKPLPVPVEEKAPVVVAKKAVTAPPKNALLNRKSPILPVVEVTKAAVAEKTINPEYRDFRYGASFIWDYNPMIPQLEKDINLASKIPDALFPIQDRSNLDDAKEAHLQLTINFYREEKWGLMNKSITLYEKKYGRDSNHVFNEYLKANALLRGNLAKPNRGITQSAMVLLTNIKDLTDNYEMKSAILRYLIQYNVDQKDHVKTLELAKQLFVEARGEFDQTMVIQSALTILHALSELKQVDKIEEFLSDKKLASILPPQMGMAYTSFALLSKGETKEIIKRYKTVEKSLVKPVHPAILYNLAESYYREAQYESSIKAYDEFLATYSYLLQSPYARLRLALEYELLDRPAAENLVLYKNAIDRSTSAEIRYEAKLRYVAFRLARKLKPTESDKETEVFLEQSPDESKALNPNLKKLLWLVRLRLFIANKEYDKALSYLTSVPLDALKPAERRVFEGDGAEIVYGLIQEAYLKEDYSKVVKIWEVYKDKYETKVAKNLYMNFVVCDAFIKLGLYKSYDRALASFKNVLSEEARTFPIWIDRTKSINLSQMIEELNLIRLVADANWTEAGAKLTSYPVSLRDSLNYPFYQGMIHFNQKNYSEAVVEFEKVLVKQNPQNQLTPRQTADLLMGYVESLYQLRDQDRFKTVVKALSDDIGRSKSAPILNISERINYLLIESYAGESNPEWKELETMTKTFREKFVKSPYNSRVGYLYGLSLIKNAKVPEGREVLSLLTNDKNVPSHIKEMCRSELATLELTEKKL